MAYLYILLNGLNFPFLINALPYYQQIETTSAPFFESRRVSCNVSERNQWRLCADFTKSASASQNGRYESLNCYTASKIRVKVCSFENNLNHCAVHKCMSSRALYFCGPL